MNNLQIEPYNDSYKNAVAELIVNIQSKEFGIPITLDMQPDLKDIPGFYQTRKGNFWITRMENKVIGTIALLDIGNNQGALRKMFVGKEYRGSLFGVGQALLNTLTDWAKAKRMTEIFLGTTEKYTGAQRFYEKNGFEEIVKKQLPEAFPVMDVDVKFYRNNLPG